MGVWDGWASVETVMGLLVEWGMMNAKRLSSWVGLIGVGAMASSVGAQTWSSKVARTGVLVIHGRHGPHIPGHPWVMPPVIGRQKASPRSTDKLAGAESSERAGIQTKSGTSDRRAEVAAQHNVQPRTQKPAWKYTPKRNWRYQPPRRNQYRPLTGRNYQPRRSFAYRARRF